MLHLCPLDMWISSIPADDTAEIELLAVRMLMQQPPSVLCHLQAALILGALPDLLEYDGVDADHEYRAVEIRHLAEVHLVVLKAHASLNNLCQKQTDHKSLWNSAEPAPAI